MPLFRRHAADVPHESLNRRRSATQKSAPMRSAVLKDYRAIAFFLAAPRFAMRSAERESVMYYCRCLATLSDEFDTMMLILFFARLRAS